MRQVHVLALVMCALSVAGCQGTTLGSGDCNDLGTGAEAQKLEAFLDTAARFETDAFALAGAVEAECAAMAAELGVSVPRASEDELQVEVTCQAVSAEIEAILDAALPAGASLTLEYVPPVCSFELSAMADCVAECDANVTADVHVECTEGRLVGSCSGTCTGECRVEGEVACEAECRGSCTGSCEGSCYGACEGECSAFDSEGNCIGTCAGTCSGSCSGTCSGTCEGTCVAEVSGSCTGSCAGSCDVDFEAPRCEGQASVEADVDCRAACDAELSARAECSEPSVTLYTTAEIDPAAQARLAELVTTLRAHLPRLLALQAQLQGVVDTGAELVTTVRDAARAAGRLSVTAGLCFTDAAARLVDAVAAVEVSFTVTVEVSASVTATAE